MRSTCDLRDLRCSFCDVRFQMHLGDFKTDASELAVVCRECASKRARELLSKRFVLWFCCDLDCAGDPPSLRYEVDLVVVVSETDNAWSNRFINHPNAYVAVPLVEWSPSSGLKVYDNVESLRRLLRCFEVAVDSLDRFQLAVGP